MIDLAQQMEEEERGIIEEITRNLSDLSVTVWISAKVSERKTVMYYVNLVLNIEVKVLNLVEKTFLQKIQC